MKQLLYVALYSVGHYFCLLVCFFLCSTGYLRTFQTRLASDSEFYLMSLLNAEIEGMQHHTRRRAPLPPMKIYSSTHFLFFSSLCRFIIISEIFGKQWDSNNCCLFLSTQLLFSCSLLSLINTVPLILLQNISGIYSSVTLQTTY